MEPFITWMTLIITIFILLLLEITVKMFKTTDGFMKNQCYLAYKNSKGILIDPAWEYDTIMDFLNINAIDIVAIFLTHSHVDHTNLAQRFANENNVPVFMSSQEIDAYPNFKMQNLKRVHHLESIRFDDFHSVPIVTPGHTLGSTCYYIDNHIFSGDTVFIEGVGVCDYNNAGKLYDSIQFLKSYLSKTTLFWPGHSFGEKPGKDLSHLLKNNIYFQFNSVKHFVDFRMRKNRPDPFAFK